MNAKEAREKISKGEEWANDNAINLSYHWEAKGYLAALEGPEVEALVEALENYHTPDDPNHSKTDNCDTCNALAAFRKAVKS
jgi:hypothetical protein